MPSAMLVSFVISLWSGCKGGDLNASQVVILPQLILNSFGLIGMVVGKLDYQNYIDNTF